MMAQALAAFALHATWQVPLLALAAWMAVRVARPHARVAYVVWAVTLLLAVVAPVCATVQGYVAARDQAELTATLVTYNMHDVLQTAAPLQREAAWLRVLHRHISSSHGLTPVAFTLSAHIARVIAVLYLAALAIAVARFVRSVRRSRSLVRSSLPATSAELLHAIQDQANVLGVPAPACNVSNAIAGPMLAGTLRPTLLLPACTAKMEPAELRAVLAHELAHVRRGDPVAHAVCSTLLLPLSFHPAAHWIATRISHTREMACDADAVAQIGSATAYADALLCVAARMVPVHGSRAMALGLFDGSTSSLVSVRDGRPRTSQGSATADLSLFGATGALEERMQSILIPTRTSSKYRLARGIAAAAVAVTALGAACMFQVQPALAAQDAPALSSAKSAQQQLSDADRRLADARANATTDDDRRKIATAQHVIQTAKEELASNGIVDQRAPFDGLDAQMAELQQRLDSPEFHTRLQKQVADAEAMRITFDSPEFKIQLKKQIADAEAMRIKFDSPEFKIKLQKQLADAEAMRLKFESPEFKIQFEKQMADAEAMRQKFESPEFKARMQKQVEDARRMQERFNSPEFRASIEKQVAAANALIARNDFVFPDGNPQAAASPRKVPASVMAGQVLQKTTPVYPASAKQAHIQGEVLLHVLIDETGKVEQVSTISSPDDALTQSATDAVRQWTYKPYLLNGKPTAVESTVTVTYSFAG